MSWTIKGIILLVVAVTAFGAGWRIKGAFVAERDLAVLEAKKEFIEAYRKEEGKTAAIFENRLMELRANEKVIERERIKIVDRPIYHTQCIDADGLRIIESARAGKSVPAKPTGKVSKPK